jgi:translation initiation factor 4A
MEQSEELIDSTNIAVTDTFEAMNIQDSLLRGIYSSGFEKPSTIQQKTTKPLILGQNLIVQAQSGTGKTTAFTIGLLQLINSSVSQCQALVLVPMFEHAQKFQRSVLQLGQYLKINCHACIGGTDVQESIRILENGVHIVMGTPGEVLDMISFKHLATTHLRIVVIDNADEMMVGRVKEEIQGIFRHLHENLQCCMFSDTMSTDILELATGFMRDPIKIIKKDEELTISGITQYYIFLEKEEWKLETLADLIETFQITQAKIYANTRKTVETLSKQMMEKNFLVSFIHGDMDRTQIDQIMRDFRTGSTRILILTDLLAHVIDLQVGLVINYDMPINYDNYLHRIGRSGAYGRKGVAICLVTEADMKSLKGLEQYYDIRIEELPQDFEL